jgi:hypothetical protein
MISLRTLNPAKPLARRHSIATQAHQSIESFSGEHERERCDAKCRNKCTVFRRADLPEGLTKSAGQDRRHTGIYYSKNQIVAPGLPCRRPSFGGPDAGPPCDESG